MCRPRLKIVYCYHLSLLENGSHRLAPWRTVTNLPFVNDAVSAEHNKVECNKTRSACFCLPAPPSLLGCELSKSWNMYCQYALIGLTQLFAHSRSTESVTHYLERKVCPLENLLFECKSCPSENKLQSFIALVYSTCTVFEGEIQKPFLLHSIGCKSPHLTVVRKIRNPGELKFPWFKKKCTV